MTMQTDCNSTKETELIIILYQLSRIHGEKMTLALFSNSYSRSGYKVELSSLR